MNDAELFYIVNNYKYTVLTGITVIILGFIIKFAIKIYKAEKIKTKKIVHYTEYKVSYIFSRQNHSAPLVLPIIE